MTPCKEFLLYPAFRFKMTITRTTLSPSERQSYHPLPEMRLKCFFCWVQHSRATTDILKEGIKRSCVTIQSKWFATLNAHRSKNFLKQILCREYENRYYWTKIIHSQCQPFFFIYFLRCLLFWKEKCLLNLFSVTNLRRLFTFHA